MAQGLLDFINTPAGMGLLSGITSYAMNARRGTPVNNIGRGLAGGLAGYAGAQENAFIRQIKQTQIEQIQAEIARKKAMQEAAAQAAQLSTKPAVPAQFDLGGNIGNEGFASMAAEQNQFINEAQGSQLPEQPIQTQEAQAGGFDPEAYRQNMLTQLAQAGLPDEAMKFAPEKMKPVALGKTLVDPATGRTIAVDETWQEDQKAQREQRIAELNMRLEDQRLSREQSNALRRELAEQQIALRRDMAEQSNAIRRDTLAQGNKPPAGYRYTPDGRLEPIPGGPADINAGEIGAKREKQKELSIAQSESVLNEIKDAKKLVGITTAGFGGLTKGIPMTAARDLDAKLTSIKANLGFDRLQQMREASPTGGALGQVAVQELVALQSTIASLDQLQSPSQLKQALGKIEKHYTNWQKTLEGGESGRQPANPATAKDLPKKPIVFDAEKERRYQEWKRSQGK